MQLQSRTFIFSLSHYRMNVREKCQPSKYISFSFHNYIFDHYAFMDHTKAILYVQLYISILSMQRTHKSILTIISLWVGLSLHHLLKFIYSEKATKVLRNLPVDLNFKTLFRYHPQCHLLRLRNRMQCFDVGVFENNHLVIKASICENS